MAKQVAKHTHKLRRHRYSSGSIIFFCALPDCSVKITPALALGKRCICWRCGEEFILSEYAIRLAKPHCENCHKPKKLEEITEDATIRIIVNDESESVTVLPAITSKNTAADLRNRLTSVLHSKTEDEDI